MPFVWTDIPVKVHTLVIIDSFYLKITPFRSISKMPKVQYVVTEAPDIGFHAANIQIGTVKSKLTSDVMLGIITDPKITTPWCRRPNTPPQNSSNHSPPKSSQNGAKA
jgi:hypothetical protein